jgi:Ca2+-binding RTX toxin-like protein
VMSGGDQHDVLIARDGGGYTMDGGNAGDWIIGPRNGTVTVIGGHGNDVIDVSRNPDSDGDVVSCGISTDTVYADPQDIVDDECEHVLSGPAPEIARVTAAMDEADAFANEIVP